MAARRMPIRRAAVSGIGLGVVIIFVILFQCRAEEDFTTGAPVAVKMKDEPPPTTAATAENDRDKKALVSWVVLIAFILCPTVIILLIHILLLTRSRRAKTRSSVVRLEYPVKLFPTMPNEHYYPPLRMIQMDENSKIRFYYLDTETCVKFMGFCQLYHPHSGMLFQLLPNVLYDPVKQCNIHTDDGQTGPLSPNHLYSALTNEIFERYMFMAYDPKLDQFYLNDSEAFARIPMLPPQQAPEDYMNTYIHLLKRDQQNRSKSFRFRATAPMETTTNLRKSPPKMQPLLLDKRDFSKPQTADFVDTPRTQDSMQPKSNMPAAPAVPPTAAAPAPAQPPRPSPAAPPDDPSDFQSMPAVTQVKQEGGAAGGGASVGGAVGGE